MSNNTCLHKFLLISIIIIAGVLLYNLNIQENYIKIGNQQFRVNSEIEQIKITEGTDTFDDALFSDVVFYMGDGTLEGEIGLEKCLKECKNGNCVEYGVTGDAYCFPNNYESVKNKFLETIKDKMALMDF